MNRLLRANAGLGQPILRLAIDGLDECAAPELQDRMRAIIRWFWQENRSLQKKAGSLPQATLVVTCRSRDVMDEAYFSDLTGSHDASAEIPTIIVSDFSDEELLQVSEHCSMTVQSIIRGEARPSETRDLLASYPITLERPFNTGLPGDSKVVAALRHPSMWGAFAELSEASQIAALNCERIALAEMAHHFRKRFHRKLARRDKKQGLEFDEFDLILGQVVTQTLNIDGKLMWQIQNWTDAVCATGHLSSVQARELYKEALSGGLIAESSIGIWYWKYPIIVMDLVTVR